MNEKADRTELEALIVEIEDQERRLVFTRFTNDDAWELGSLLVRLGRERSLTVTIDIRRNGHQLFHAALAGTAPGNDSWINRKVNVVNRFGESSFLVGRRLELYGVTLDEGAGVAPIDYAAHGGSFPISIVDVGVVGSVTVSGLPQVADHALVVEAITEFLGVA